jgi:hypothetical protein
MIFGKQLWQVAMINVYFCEIQKEMVKFQNREICDRPRQASGQNSVAFSPQANYTD